MRLATPDDYPRIEVICNDPGVRLWACDGAPPFSTSRLVPPSFAVLGVEGCFLAMSIEPSRYMVHTNILPDFRGELARIASEEALRIAFCQTDALELETLTPVTIPHAQLFARQMGFRYRFTREKLWPWRGELHNVNFLSMSILDWALSGSCRDAGEAFHQRLHDELGQSAHPDGAAHNAIVGAAVEMVRAGRAHKAVAFYNYWARVAGYQRIQIVSLDPLRIDIHQCVLRVEGDQFFIEEASHA
jgi:hypothetical protein